MALSRNPNPTNGTALLTNTEREKTKNKYLKVNTTRYLRFFSSQDPFSVLMTKILQSLSKYSAHNVLGPINSHHFHFSSQCPNFGGFLQRSNFSFLDPQFPEEKKNHFLFLKT